MKLIWGCFLSGHILKLFQAKFSVHFNMGECLRLHPIFLLCPFCLRHCRNPTNLVDTDTGVLGIFSPWSSGLCISALTKPS